MKTRRDSHFLEAMGTNELIRFVSNFGGYFIRTYFMDGNFSTRVQGQIVSRGFKESLDFYRYRSYSRLGLN